MNKGLRDSLGQMILASSSPRRRQLLSGAGYKFQVQAPPIPEPNDLPQQLSPAGYAEAQAYFKARCVARTHTQVCVLGADTIVAEGGRILGKPNGAEDARCMLAELSATRHAVITGVALIGPGDRRLIASESSYVTMRPLTEHELDDYIASGEWEGKAGAYAIQETADRFVQKVEGSFSNVVGLPLELLARMISTLTNISEGK